VHHAFEPLVGNDPRILILGSFPSPASREKGEYYGNPRNSFWRIVFDTYGVPFDCPDYDEKKNVLYRSNVALWDVVGSCDIEGALDSDIKNPALNLKLPGFIFENNIKSVFFNGGKAFELYRRGIGLARNDTVNFQTLPSTSPANARMGYREKLSIWSRALSGENNL
jgi:hypoxanthine-DNA glycosylase